MPGSIYLKTLHDLRWSMVAWSLGLAVIGAVNVLFYPTIERMPDIVAFLENLPPAFKAMIGDVRDMVRFEGFLRIKLFEPLPLLLAVFAVSQGGRLLAGELDHKSIDLLLARPIHRWRVVVEKYLAVASAVVAPVLAVAVGVIVAARIIAVETGTGYLLLAALSSLPLVWLFAALAVLGSALLRHTRQATLAAGAVVVASYVLETLRLISPALSGWGSVSPFAQQKACFSLAGRFSLEPTLLLLGSGLVLVLAAVLVWERRDLVP